MRHVLRDNRRPAVGNESRARVSTMRSTRRHTFCGGLNASAHCTCRCGVRGAAAPYSIRRTNH